MDQKHKNYTWILHAKNLYAKMLASRNFGVFKKNKKAFDLTKCSKVDNLGWVGLTKV